MDDYEKKLKLITEGSCAEYDFVSVFDNVDGPVGMFENRGDEGTSQWLVIAQANNVNPKTGVLESADYFNVAGGEEAAEILSGILRVFGDSPYVRRALHRHVPCDETSGKVVKKPSA